MTTVKALLELEILQEKISGLEKQLKSIPEFKELKRLKQEIEECQVETVQLNQELASNKSNLKFVEESINLLKEKIGRANDELYSGNTANVKELEAAQKNIDRIKEKVEESEEHALKMMEDLDNNEKIFNELVEVLEKKKKEFRQLHKFYNDKKLELASALEEAAANKEALSKTIEPGLIEKYRLQGGNYSDGKAIARLNNGVCSGCHMTVSFDLRKQAKSKDLIITCDNCGRFLVVD